MCSHRRSSARWPGAPVTFRVRDRGVIRRLRASRRRLLSIRRPRPRSRVNRLLWVVQAILALLFLFAGSAKLVMSAADLTAQTPLPAGLLRFVAVMEILGGLGLVLPGILHIQMKLTPLAAAGLVI